MSSQSLSLEWAFGFSKTKSNIVHSMCTKERNALFFVSSHSGVLYDFEHRTQTILQGHCNIISCCAVDRNKRWIVTADAGFDPIMVVWDAITCVPVKTFSLPHEAGVEAIDISDDAMFIVTLSAQNESLYLDQEIAVWAWTTNDSSALVRHSIQHNEAHKVVKFNPRDHSQIVSTGSKSVLYWNWNELSLDSYYGKVSKSDLGNYSGSFTSSIFLPGTEIALTATSDGFVIVWETQGDSVVRNSSLKNKLMKKATKVLRLVECGIETMTTTENEYLVVGSTDGAVRFFDYFLRLEAWYEDLCAGPVSSVSFSIQDCPFPLGDAGAPGLKFWVPDFIVATTDAFVVGVESAIFDEVRREDRRGTLLLQGMSGYVSALACHPHRPHVAINCANGVLQIWNYEMKLLMNLREFNDRSASAGGMTLGKIDTKNSAVMRSSCLAFDSTGDLLAVGFTNGTIKLMSSASLEDSMTFIPSSDGITDIQFSPSGLFMAAVDEGDHILLFEREGDEAISNNGLNLAAASSAFVYLGRCLSHRDRITGLSFGLKDGLETLISISTDKCCVEYDLQASNVSKGVICVKMRPEDLSSQGGQSFDSEIYFAHRMELVAKPTAIAWHPKIGDDIEDRFVVANDQFKFKEFNADSKQCRKTSLAPRFGSSISRLLNIPQQFPNANMNTTVASQSFYAFATDYRVIGVGSFPLTGDPSRMVGIVAHPVEVKGIAVSYDGRFLFSAGGSDLSANMWRLNVDGGSTGYTTAEAAEGAEGMGAFFSLLEGGEDGELYRDIVDYFYYCQLRQMGEDAMDRRALPGTVVLQEIPSLFRAVGFYPSEDEVANITSEVKYKNFMSTGELVDAIGLNDLIKLYLNHRPVVPLDKANVAEAIKAIGKVCGSSNGAISWETLRSFLTAEGEAIGADTLDSYLTALIGGDSKSVPGSTVYDPKSFSEEILGFEDFQADF